MFAQTFTRLAARGVRPGVLYPAVAVPAAADLQEAEQGWQAGLPAELAAFIRGGPTFLSINRFERKKVGGWVRCGVRCGAERSGETPCFLDVPIAMGNGIA